MGKNRPGQRPMTDWDLTVTEAAALLGHTRQSVLYAIGAEKLPARRMGKAGYIIRLSDINRAYRKSVDGFMLWPGSPGRAGLLLIDKKTHTIKKGS